MGLEIIPYFIQLYRPEGSLRGQLRSRESTIPTVKTGRLKSRQGRLGH